MNAFSTPSANGDILKATSIPSAFCAPRPTAELQIDSEYTREARAIYSSTIGVEINHIYAPERRRWIYEQMESEPQPEDQARILDLLIRADIFEQVMQQRYLGSKRFSLEGVTALIPLVDELLDTRLTPRRYRTGHGHEPSRTSQRDRPRRQAADPEEIFAGFEDVDPRSVLGSGDVKYHMGATGEYLDAQRQQSSYPSGFEPQPSRGRRSRHRRPHSRQTGPQR